MYAYMRDMQCHCALRFMKFSFVNADDSKGLLRTEFLHVSTFHSVGC